MKKRNWSIWVLVLVLAFLLPLLVNCGLRHWNIPTAPGVDNTHWLGFWGSYFGGFLGCLPVLLALHESRKQAQRQHDEFQEQLQESRKQAKQQHEEFQKQLQELEADRHFAKLPMLHIQTAANVIPSLRKLDMETHINIFRFDPDGFFVVNFERIGYFIEKLAPKLQRNLYFFDIQNIGFGPALNVTVYTHDGPPFKLGTSAPGSELKGVISFENCPARDQSFDYIKHRIDFTFHDILGWKYTQHQDFQLTGAGAKFDPITSPERLHDI